MLSTSFISTCILYERGGGGGRGRQSDAHRSALLCSKFWVLVRSITLAVRVLDVLTEVKFSFKNA